MTGNLQSAMARWSAAGMDVIDIGDTGGKDLDLVVVGSGMGPGQATANLHVFTDSTGDALSRCDAVAMIVRQEHFGYAPRSSVLLHLLFYPTLEHIVAWELPSFCAHTAAVGDFVSGTAERYLSLLKNYAQGRPTRSWESRRRHLLSYGSAACAGAVYTSGATTPVPLRQVSVTFRSAVRFATAEILRPSPFETDTGLWWRNSVAQELLRQYPDQGHLHDLLGMTVDEIEQLAPEVLHAWHHDLFALTEYGKPLLTERLLFTKEAIT